MKKTGKKEVNIQKKSGKGSIKAFRDFLSGGAVRWYDWVILAVLMLFCFVVFCMSDLYHTTACSFGYLNGHILDFYDYLASSGIAADGSTGIHASYMPTIYVLFAVWNIPLRLFGIVRQPTMQLGFAALMWAKLFPTLVFFFSAWILYLVAKELKMDRRKGLLLVYAYLSCPVLLYGQLVIGQYESLFILCVLMGFLFWLREKPVGFILAFGIAVTFKYTALIIFFPLLLLKEKKILKVLLYAVLVMIPFAVEYLVYMHSPAFMSYAFGIGSSGDTPTNYITNAALFTGFTFGGNLNFVIYLAVVSFALVCAWAYFTDTHTDTEAGRYGVFFSGLALTVLFLFSKWHSHWLMPLFVFFTLGAFMHRKTGAFMALDLLFGVLFIMFCTCQFEGAHDEAMINAGIFKFFLPGRQISAAYSLTDYFRFLDMSMELSLLTAVMVVNAVFMHPKFMAEDINLSADHEIGWIRARYIISLLVLILPTVLVTAHSLKGVTAVYEEDRRGIFMKMQDEETLTQPFVSEGTTVTRLIFPVSRGALYDTPEMMVSLKDGSGNVLYSKEVDVGDYFEGQLVRLKPSGVTLVPGETYYVEFRMLKVTPDSTFCLLAFDQGDYMNALDRNNKDAGCHMNLRIYQ